MVEMIDAATELTGAENEQSKEVADEGAEKEKEAVNGEENGGVKEKPVEREPRPPFKFNIADGGFTELHALWVEMGRERECRMIASFYKFGIGSPKIWIIENKMQMH